MVSEKELRDLQNFCLSIAGKWDVIRKGRESVGNHLIEWEIKV